MSKTSLEMRHSGTFLHFILCYVLACLPLVTSRSLYPQNPHGSADIYSSNIAFTTLNTRLTRRMQHAAVVPVSGPGSSSSSQNSPTRPHAVDSSHFRDDGANTSTNLQRPIPALPFGDIEMGIIHPSAASQTAGAPSSTVTAQAGHLRTQQPPRLEFSWDPYRRACFTTYSGALGCVGGVVCVVGGLASGEIATTVGGGVCAVLGAVLTREGYAEWKRNEELENLEQQQRVGSQTRNLNPRELGQLGLGKGALGRVSHQCHCIR